MQAHRRTARRRGSILGLVALLGMLVGGGGAPAPALAETGSVATVAGAPAVNIRRCPKPACAVVARARVGDTVETTGAAVDGFVPVRYDGTRGYAFGLYLAGPDDPVTRFDRGPEGCNRIALIFNVGVGYATDTSILDTLERFDVPATVFVMGWWAEENPKLMARMVEQGLVIGNHGEALVEPLLRSDWEIVQDIQVADAKIRGVVGDALGPWFTPYAAGMDDRVRALVAGAGYLPVGWEVPAADFGADATATSVWDRVVPNAYDGAIVEMHLDGPASAASTGTALPWVIDALSERGYEFVTIPELTMPCGVEQAD